jgi:hypothetical protein
MDRHLSIHFFDNKKAEALELDSFQSHNISKNDRRENCGRNFTII